MPLGDVASVATLVLFVFYFLGRAWTITKEKALMRESFALEKTEFDDEFIEDRENYYDIDGTGEIISITSEIPILWMKVISIKYSGDWVDITPRKVAPIVDLKKPIQSNCPIFLRMDIPDGMPVYKIRFCRFDYMIVSFDIGYNGRVGGMAPVHYKVSHTVRSLLYYLLK